MQQYSSFFGTVQSQNSSKAYHEFLESQVDLELCSKTSSKKLVGKYQIADADSL